jgi:arsenite methyltransferase
LSDIRELVRERYAQAARRFGWTDEPEQTQPGCCGETSLDGRVDRASGCCGETASSSTEGATGGCGSVAAGFGHELYEIGERDSLPESAVLASLGCGNPTAVADLHPGETVLDLGSGGGIDVLLSARRVGASGKAYGLDMTDEMLALALENRAKAGATNVEFLKGYIEAIPLPSGVIDVVISNCVINLAADKQKVFAETWRVLKPGGRLRVSDVVASDDLTPADRADRGSCVGCIAGALSFSEYTTGLLATGFEDVSIAPTHAVAEGMQSATIKATKPATQVRSLNDSSPSTRDSESLEEAL